jgi:hypothetical protein
LELAVLTRREHTEQTLGCSWGEEAFLAIIDFKDFNPTGRVAFRTGKFLLLADGANPTQQNDDAVGRGGGITRPNQTST